MSTPNDLEVLIGDRLIAVTQLKALAENSIDGDDLAGKVAKLVANTTHEDHVAIIRWYWRWDEFKAAAKEFAEGGDEFVRGMAAIARGRK